MVNFYVVHNGVQLRVAVDFAKDQPARMAAASHPNQVILASLKLHLVDKIPDFFSTVLQQMEIKIDPTWALVDRPGQQKSFMATAKAEDLSNIKLFDAISDVSNIKASRLELTVTKNPGKGAFCKLTVLLKPKSAS